MDKRVIFAVAGSGKTTFIIDNLNYEKRTLLVTYTIENYQTLRRKISIKFGCIPENITIYTYFQFLYQYCIRPLLGYSANIRGIDWKASPPQRTSKSNERHYLTNERRLYHNRMAKLLIESNSMNEVCERIEKYFDLFCVDEVQDFAANDFNFLMAVCQANLEILFVGDFYQHTFDTSRDGNTRGNLHKDYEKYKAEFQGVGLHVDNETLVKSYRCSPQICAFVTEKLGIAIESHRNDSTELLAVDEEETAITLFSDDGTVKLFYDLQSKYQCNSNNWGKSKGRDDYHDVCVVLNQTTQGLFEADKLTDLNPTTRNKLYVALTRARGSVHLVPHSFYDSLKKD